MLRVNTNNNRVLYALTSILLPHFFKVIQKGLLHALFFLYYISIWYI